MMADEAEGSNPTNSSVADNAASSSTTNSTNPTGPSPDSTPGSSAGAGGSSGGLTMDESAPRSTGSAPLLASSGSSANTSALDDGDDDTPAVDAPNPVAGSDGRLNVPDPTRGQGAGAFMTSRDGGKRRHQGVDITADEGTPVQSRVDGQVIKSISEPPYSTAMTPPRSVDPNVANGAGNRVVVQGSDGRTYSYFHLNGQDQPKVGDRVVAGQVIGHVGRTGNVPSRADTHLHHEVHAPNGQALDPNVPRSSTPSDPDDDDTYLP
jgi:murein DD-endopeptidase MepM/ murein hydrolase activator NlpD